MPVKNTVLYLNRFKNILRAFGVWLPPKNYVLLYQLYAVLVMLTQYSFVLFEFIYIAKVWGDLDEVSEASYLLFTQASLCYKSTAFLVNKEKLVQLLGLMESETFAPQTKRHERLLHTQARTIKRLCTFFMTSAVTTTTLWAMTPLFDDAGAGARTFPFKIWMPFGPETSPHYELGYIYQMLCIYISALLFIGVDSVAVSMIMFGCAQLEIVMDKLQQIKNVPLSEKQDEKIKRKKENNEVFVESVKHHQAVIRFVELCEDTYHANIFFQLSGTVAIICIIGLRISIVEPNSVQFFSMINYLVTMLSQLFLYCWCGNELTARSQNLRDSMYLCPWYEQDLTFRRSLWIAMERMKRPIIFKAGRYIPLSRPTFVSILRSSYSYFAVINQANNK